MGEPRPARPAWAHPIASLVHVLFKLAGVVAYEMVYALTGAHT